MLLTSNKFNSNYISVSRRKGREDGGKGLPNISTLLHNSRDVKEARNQVKSEQDLQVWEKAFEPAW